MVGVKKGNSERANPYRLIVIQAFVVVLLAKGTTMAVNAYVLVNVEPARTQAVLESMQTISGAVVHEVLGPYDMVVDLEADTHEDITAILRNRIRPIHGITDTVTCICL